MSSYKHTAVCGEVKEVNPTKCEEKRGQPNQAKDEAGQPHKCSLEGLQHKSYVQTCRLLWQGAGPAI